MVPSTIMCCSSLVGCRIKTSLGRPMACFELLPSNLEVLAGLDNVLIVDVL